MAASPLPIGKSRKSGAPLPMELPSKFDRKRESFRYRQLLSHLIGIMSAAPNFDMSALLAGSQAAAKIPGHRTLWLFRLFPMQM
jgi:hypothetical protein